MIKVLLYFFLLLSFFTGSAQPETPKVEVVPYIEVTGTAEKEVIPDEILIKIVLKERFVNRENQTVVQQEEKLKEAISALNIDLQNFYLADANADHISILWKKDVLTRKDYLLKVSNAETVGKVFRELDRLEIKDAFISRVSHSKLDSLRKEVKIEAIKAAKSKAGYLLSAIGEEPGKPMIVREIEIRPAAELYSVNVRGSINSEKEYYVDGIKDRVKLDEEIQFQKIKIQASIYIKYAIK